MKANEVPEKIFLDEDESWHLTNPNGDSVEYIHTDVFIERTCEWLEKYKQKRDIIDKRTIEDYRNYMKGEKT